MRARFVGDPKQKGHGPDVAKAFGLLFPKGQWVSIDGNAMALAKLPNNSHYEVDSKPAPAAKPAEKPQETPQQPRRGGRRTKAAEVEAPKTPEDDDFEDID